jgi:hypothetical protein
VKFITFPSPCDQASGGESGDWCRYMMIQSAVAGNGSSPNLLEFKVIGCSSVFVDFQNADRQRQLNCIGRIENLAHQLTIE